LLPFPKFIVVVSNLAQPWIEGRGIVPHAVSARRSEY
jgi:hypothetical protein